MDHPIYLFRLNFDGYIDSVKAYSQDITQLGVQWHFTEVTVRTLDEGDSEFMTNEEQFQQAELYSGLMQVGEGVVWYCILKCKLFTLLRCASTSVRTPASPSRPGVTRTGKKRSLSGQSPISQKSIFRYTNWEQIDGKKPFLFDYDNNPKVSYYSVVEALQNTEAA